MSYYIGLEYGAGERAILTTRQLPYRSVGELLQNQMRIGFSRMDASCATHANDTRYFLDDAERHRQYASDFAAIKEFFGSSQLSQLWISRTPWPR